MSDHWTRVDEREAELLDKVRESKLDLDEILNFLKSARKEETLIAQMAKGTKTSEEVMEALIARVEALEERVGMGINSPSSSERELYDKMSNNLKSSVRVGELVRCLVRTLLIEERFSTRRERQ